MVFDATALEAAVRSVRDDVRRRGWGCATGLPLVRNGAPDTGLIFDLAARWGRPSARDGGSPLWPVAPVSGDPEATFSQRAGRAALHTDAAYRRVAEAGVCLFVIRPARQGGWTRVLAARDLLDDLPAGHRLRARLQRPDWAWRVPAPFGGEPPFRAAVLSRGGTVRWRPDNFLPFVDDRQRWAAGEFEARAENHRAVVEMPLGRGDVVVLDNRRTLHGRTAFTDPGRLVIRVRLWSLS
jgi:hypothetical protein